MGNYSAILLREQVTFQWYDDDDDDDDEVNFVLGQQFNWIFEVAHWSYIPRVDIIHYPDSEPTNLCY
jgi:hypothetical protein